MGSVSSNTSLTIVKDSLQRRVSPSKPPSGPKNRTVMWEECHAMAATLRKEILPAHKSYPSPASSIIRNSTDPTIGSTPHSHLTSTPTTLSITDGPAVLSLSPTPEEDSKSTATSPEPDTARTNSELMPRWPPSLTATTWIIWTDPPSQSKKAGLGLPPSVVSTTSGATSSTTTLEKVGYGLRPLPMETVCLLKATPSQRHDDHILILYPH